MNFNCDDARDEHERPRPPPRSGILPPAPVQPLLSLRGVPVCEPAPLDYLSDADELHRAPVDDRTPLQVARDRLTAAESWIEAHLVICARTESERDGAAAMASRLTAELDAAHGLLAELYRATQDARRHVCGVEGLVGRCYLCALDERVEAALLAAGRSVPGDTEPPPESQRDASGILGCHKVDHG